MYLRLESIPELQMVPTQVRRKLVQRYLRTVHLSGMESLSIAFAIIVLIVLTIFVPPFLSYYFPFPNWVMISMFTSVFLTGMFWIYTVLLRILRPKLAAYVAMLHVNHRFKQCLACDYDLHGSISPTCPECGASAVLLVCDN